LSLSIDNLFVFLLMFRSFGLSPAAQRKALLLGIVAPSSCAGFIFTASRCWSDLAGFSTSSAPAGDCGIALLRTKEKTAGAPAPANWITDRPCVGAAAPGQPSSLPWRLSSWSIWYSPLTRCPQCWPSLITLRGLHLEYLRILGLRALYFLLAGLLDRLHYLHFGLAAIWDSLAERCCWLNGFSARRDSLGIIVVIVVAATAASLIWTRTSHS